MAECFVIQPFDNGKFDQRYKDTFDPAIRAAGLEPYRVDKDLSVSDLIQGIKDGIDRCAVVLADLTLDNPNVWYELGHAIAVGRSFCLICSDERTGKYPFDISHLRVTKYGTGSLSDFEKLGVDITARIKAVFTQDEQLRKLSTTVSGLPTTGGLDVFEQVALSLIFSEHLEGGVAPWTIHQKMQNAGFNKVGSTLAVINLLHRKFIQSGTVHDSQGEPYSAYTLSNLGVEWIRQNPPDLRTQKAQSNKVKVDYGDSGITDDDIPF